jgi:hypothetical protein
MKSIQAGSTFWSPAQYDNFLLALDDNSLCMIVPIFNPALWPNTAMAMLICALHTEYIEKNHADAQWAKDLPHFVRWVAASGF